MLNFHEQCRGCRHLQRRGGIVSAPELLCVAAGDENPLAPMVGRMLKMFASEGRCPEATPYEAQPDSYLSEDLIPATHLEHLTA